MRRRGSLIVLVAVLMVMAATNPTEDDFRRTLRVDARRAGNDRSVSGLINRAVDALGRGAQQLTVRRHNFVIFSLFESHSIADRRRHVGILGQVVEIRRGGR